MIDYSKTDLSSNNKGMKTERTLTVYTLTDAEESTQKIQSPIKEEKLRTVFSCVNFLEFI